MIGSRIDNYVTFLLSWAEGAHPRMDCFLREVEITDDCIEALRDGSVKLKALMMTSFVPLLEDYLNKLHRQCVDDPLNEKLIDRNSRLACDLHAHRLLMYRNMPMDTSVASATSGSFVFLTTRHTWNKATREQGRCVTISCAIWLSSCVQVAHSRDRTLRDVDSAEEAFDQLHAHSTPIRFR